MLNVRSFPSTTEIHQVDGYVSFVPDSEVGRHNPDFRSSLNSGHSDAGSARPKNVKAGLHPARRIEQSSRAMD